MRFFHFGFELPADNCGCARKNNWHDFSREGEARRHGKPIRSSGQVCAFAAEQRFILQYRRRDHRQNNKRIAAFF